MQSQRGAGQPRNSDFHPKQLHAQSYAILEVGRVRVLQQAAVMHLEASGSAPSQNSNPIAHLALKQRDPWLPFRATPKLKVRGNIDLGCQQPSGRSLPNKEI
jgi:hypothetical protein